MFAAAAFGACQVTIPKFSPQTFCETLARERVSHTVLVPTMINLLTQFAEVKQYDLSSLEVLAYGGSPMAPELMHRTRELLPNLKLVQVYGLSETGFLTGLKDQEHTDDRVFRAGDHVPESTCRSWTSQERKSKPGVTANWLLAALMSCAAIGTVRKKPR
jgi:acyl-coenzyme A synthetase/AMP-(fatty) acid ligase